jgi:hypothetical protein
VKYLLGIFQSIYYSFPVQLLIMHVKRHQLLLAIWVLFFLTVTGRFGSNLGIPYLFWDPEYLGSVGYLSFAIVGMAFGGFLVTWNITSYLLNSYRFPFLASLRWPVAVFTLNNFLLPLAFLITYGVHFMRFQRRNEFITEPNLILNMAGFFAGMALILLITTLYFSSTNQNIEGYLKRQAKKKKVSNIRRTILMKRNNRWEALRKDMDICRVDSYFSFRFRFRPTRGVEHYDEKVVKSVFRQHHLNALLIQLGTLTILVGVGVFMENPASIIPAAASSFLLFSAIVAMLGVFRFWMGGWSTTIFLLFLFGVNVVSRWDLFDYENRAYGLSYEGNPVLYSLATLDSLSTPERMQADYDHGIEILENWLAITTEERTPGYKPKMVIVNASGGGLRTAMFATGVLQVADTLTNGEFMERTAFVSGASGGMLGLAYYRELYLRKQLGRKVELASTEYTLKIGQDLLNPIMFMTTTTDIFVPWQRFKYNGNVYLKDRAYLFEKQFNENTDYILDKPLEDYREVEYQAMIPMMVTAGAITNDSRKLLFSPQPISYLMKSVSDYEGGPKFFIDAVDYGALFAESNPYEVRFTSLLRMNATYPYILPQVSLPTKPEIRVIDAGIVDNYGLSTSIRFVDVFSEWIMENTSGVVFVEIRDNQKFSKVEENEKTTYLSKLLNPIGNVYSNLTTMQDYADDVQLDLLREKLDGKVEMVRFEYIPSVEDEKASMSFHLTTKEKVDIIESLSNPANAERFRKLTSNVLD